MKSEYLVVRAVELARAPARVEIDVVSPTVGVSIVDVSVGSISTPAPLHWRAGRWSKPPLDISLSSAGVVERIQLVLQDEAVPLGNPPRTEAESGLPIFDVSQWSSDRYIDVTTDITVVRLTTGELVISLVEDKPHRIFHVGDQATIGIDNNDRLTYVAIGPLDEEQWQLIAAADDRFY